MTSKTPKSIFSLPVLVVALGYFVDIFDLTLFNMLRVPSLVDLGVAKELQVDTGILLLNCQMAGMLLGGIFWGVLGDKKGRLQVLFGSILLYSLGNLANAFVQTIPMYALLRFVSGIGLAGELGAGITLVAEILPKEKRGLGTTVIATIGVLGATLGGFMVETFHWRTCYIIGGLMGLLLLVMRVSVQESGMFSAKRLATLSASHPIVHWGKFSSLFTSSVRFKKFLWCILLGVPTWFVAGLAMPFSPELAQELGVTEAIVASKTIGISYLGLAIGDFGSGFLSQILKSRMKAMQVFLIATVIALSALFFTTSGKDATYYYTLCFIVGIGAGFWAIFVTVAAEQFGTNIRATVATSVPNFVRGSTILMTLLFKTLRPELSIQAAMITVGILVFGVSFLATFKLPETFHKDLDYLEH